jgi:hypothetical protein
MKNKISLILTLTISVIFFVIIVYFSLTKPIINFEECIAAGNPVMESYPRQCRDPISNQTFIEKLESWKLDGIQLMQHETEGSYGCFGCNDELCIDPIQEMKPIQETEERHCNSEFGIVENSSIFEIIGEVSLKGELFCPCFKVKEKMVWYDLMEGFNPINVSNIKNGDVVHVWGEIQPNGEIYALSITKESLIGGERDEYGCLSPAGYSWNETDQLCVREWTRKDCPKERGDYCVTVYEPVCGLPTRKKYSNSCFACLDTQVKQYIDGECE